MITLDNTEHVAEKIIYSPLWTGEANERKKEQCSPSWITTVEIDFAPHSFQNDATYLVFRFHLLVGAKLDSTGTKILRIIRTIVCYPVYWSLDVKEPIKRERKRRLCNRREVIQGCRDCLQKWFRRRPREKNLEKRKKEKQRGVEEAITRVARSRALKSETTNDRCGTRLK